jgi:DNA-binding beta-propeller fold protein YncE
MSLKHIATIDLPEHLQVGGFDHAAIHHGTNRLYVAHTINNAIDIIDCTVDQFVASIPNLAGVAGVLVSEEKGLVFSSNRGENTVSIFTAGNECDIVKIPVGIRPNGLAFDPQHGLLLAANVGDADVPDSFTLSILDIHNQELLHSIPVPGRTRWTVFNARRKEFYINIMEPALIVVVATDQPDRIARTNPIPAAGPHGLDFDATTDRLLCACDAGTLITLEAASGKILNSVELSGKPDVIFFNENLKHLYIAIGDPGVIDVYDTDSFSRLETVHTEKGTHTLAFDARLNKVYAFAPQNHCSLVFSDG